MAGILTALEAAIASTNTLKNEGLSRWQANLATTLRQAHKTVF